MQYIISQNNLFIQVDYKIDVSSKKIPYYERKIKKELQNINGRLLVHAGSFYLHFITNIYHRINTWKTNSGKQRFMKCNVGIIVRFDWMGTILDIERAVFRLHQIIKDIKRKYSKIIGNIDIFLSGQDYQYNTLEDKKIVKDDINNGGK
jgi:hypothetical protein